MISVKGQFAQAIVYTDTLDEGAAKNIKEMCDLEFLKESNIRIMPDVHAGKGCTIGTTMTITDKVVPNFVGVDIGCGIEVVKLKDQDIFFKLLDDVIHKQIPSGQSIRNKPHPYYRSLDLTQLKCANSVNLRRAHHSVGTLGGGNHFIGATRS